jgi:hypothetical protein
MATYEVPMEDIETEEIPKFVLQVTDSDGEIYYLPDGEDPVESFGENITVLRFQLMHPTVWDPKNDIDRI